MTRFRGSRLELTLTDGCGTCWGQIIADEKREREYQEYYQDRHEPKSIIDMIYDNKWLRDYFRNNAALLDTDLHKAYQDALSIHSLTREMYRQYDEFLEEQDAQKTEKKYPNKRKTRGTDPDIQKMLDIAKRKTKEYDCRCSEIDGHNPLKW